MGKGEFFFSSIKSTYKASLLPKCTCLILMGFKWPKMLLALAWHNKVRTSVQEQYTMNLQRLGKPARLGELLSCGSTGCEYWKWCRYLIFLCFYLISGDTKTLERLSEFPKVPS